MAKGEILALEFSDGVEVSGAAAAPIGDSYEKVVAITAVSTITFDLTIADDNGNTVASAYGMVWQLKQVNDNYKVKEGVTVDHPAATSVRFVVGADFPFTATNYLLVGR